MDGDLVVTSSAHQLFEDLTQPLRVEPLTGRRRERREFVELSCGTAHCGLQTGRPDPPTVPFRGR
jgi:hypothetical protein